MSEVLTSRYAPASIVSIRQFPSGKASDGRGSAIPVEAPALPKLEPGQLWFIELPPTAPALSPLEYRALMTANVVVYDRALASVVAGVLPLGGYGEPAAISDAALALAGERCRRFARDGWSVVRLVDPRVLSGRQRVEKIQQLAGRLLTAEGAKLPILVFANEGDGRYTTGAADLGEFAELIDTGGLGQSPTLTVIFASTDTAATPRVSVAAANGLAG